METRRKSGSRSRKVLTPDNNDDDLNDNSKRSSRNRKVLTPENRGSDSEDGGRNVGLKSNNPDSKTGELRSDEDDDRESLRARNKVTPDKKENSPDDETRRAVRGKKAKELESDIETSKSTRSEMFVSSQPTHSDTDDESDRNLSNKKLFENDGVTNEPLSEFLVDTRLKKTKKESSESGSDSGKKIKMVKKKKIMVDSDDEGFSPILENEFEDTENDSVHLAQNDGFLDASGIGSSNGSDEGADIEKPNFNDEEDEDNFDLSDIITKLDVQFEDDPSHRKIDHCYRFKCKLCGLDSNSRDKLEDHFKSCHHNKIPQKILTKQEMAIHIHRKKLSAEDKEMAEAMVAAMGRPKLSPKDKDKLVETMKARKEAKKKAKKGVARQPSPLELTGEAYPFFKYASDDVTEPMVDKEKTICIFDRSSRSPQNDMNDDNIDSLLDEDPLKEEVPTKKVGRSRYTERKVDSKSKEMDPNITSTTKSITAKDDDFKDEEDEITKHPRQKTTVGKDFVLWANDIKETSGRSSRSSKSSVKKSDDEISNCEETPSGRSSRGSNRGKKKISLTRSRKEKGDREQSPHEDSVSDTNSDKKDDDDFINTRKSPSNMILMNRDALSPVPNTGISGPVFECLKCGTKLIQRKDLVLNHLKSHKLNFESYIDIYVEQASSSKLSAVIEWRAEDLPAKNEDLFNSLMAEGPICPPHLGPKFGTKPEPEQKESGSSGPKLGNTSLLCEDKGERDSASKFKVLYSTLDGGGSQDQSSENSQDHLSSALSSILSDEEKQELLLSPLKKTLKSAGIEVEEKDGAEKQKFVLRVKLNKH